MQCLYLALPSREDAGLHFLNPPTNSSGKIKNMRGVTCLHVNKFHQWQCDAIIIDLWRYVSKYLSLESGVCADYELSQVNYCPSIHHSLGQLRETESILKEVTDYSFNNPIMYLKSVLKMINTMESPNKGHIE